MKLTEKQLTYFERTTSVPTLEDQKEIKNAIKLADKEIEEWTEFKDSAIKKLG